MIVLKSSIVLAILKAYATLFTQSGVNITTSGWFCANLWNFLYVNLNLGVVPIVMTVICVLAENEGFGYNYIWSNL
jgi:uncharacterized Tic20 family protein